MLDKNEIAGFFMNLQDSICHSLEEADGNGTFVEDSWKRDSGGGGRTRVITNGAVLEKGGVAFSKIYGATSESIRNQLTINGVSDFFATGISIVIHPHSPMIPIIHMNVRYFEMSDGNCWFGGGIDLTPHYIDDNDTRYFHDVLKHICDEHHPLFYQKFKKWCDDYFFIKHRNETRGVGGIFFDYLKPDDYGMSQEDIFDFVVEVAESFAPIYTYLMNKNREIPYGEQEKYWQGIRRGRYVEFNLIYDRGTKFGLDSDGRTESILMTLPKNASWEYNYKPKANTPEDETLRKLKKNIKWASEAAFA